MDKYGYTGSACIPMAFDDAVQKGKVKKGDVLFMSHLPFKFYKLVIKLHIEFLKPSFEK